MNAEIFAAEISLGSSRHRHKVVFNDTQVKAYLSGLSVYYTEVLLVSDIHHVFLAAIGHSPALMLSSLNEIVTQANDIHICRSSEDAIHLFQEIARGKHWAGVDEQQARTMIIR